MRQLTLLLIVLAMACCLVSTTPVDRKKIFINHPTEGPYGLGRSPQDVKGTMHNRRQGSFTKQELNLRKGEYVCGNKICRLEPGIPPKNCEDCQYRV